MALSAPFIVTLNSFTFQYVSINTHVGSILVFRFFSLHSNMFLLILVLPAALLAVFPPLHSNMFLLIHLSNKSTTTLAPYFTFQYVSINTLKIFQMCLGIRPLHSNMFLLIRQEKHLLLLLTILYIPICFY